jgi:oxygen-independent coproporphyrinogen-3 oxidase
MPEDMTAPISLLPYQLRQDLDRRMAMPQRHRLLQGYPMAPLMRKAGAVAWPLLGMTPDNSRPLIIGVLPHTSCNPKVRGCGFCTFPHERFDNTQVRRVVEGVVKEVELVTTFELEVARRRVGALYFGGGTANLTPPEAFRSLAGTLEGAFDLSDSEVTLEGVPRYFLLHDGALLDTLAGMKVRHRRLSMGVQTFDPEWLKRMGRDAFGDAECIQQVVNAAHARGFTVSADLLFNLPGRTLEQTLEDVRTAMAMGFDQVCVYNLVLNADLDTEWAKDAAMVGRMPDPERACRTWLEVRRVLLDGGFVQTTLTNFERREVAGTPRRFLYELASFDPATWDALGFGPAAISTFTAADRQGAWKWSNAPDAAGYLELLEQDSVVTHQFGYAPRDLRLLHLTRNLARLCIDRAGYEAFFGNRVEADFGAQVEVLVEAGLLDGALALTPQGMFFADSVAGLLADSRVRELRASEPGNEVQRLRTHMG